MGLASAVVQIVHFTTKVASKGYEYQKTTDGVLKEYIEIDEYANNLSRLSQRLSEATMDFSGSQLAEEEEALISGANDCQAICREITGVLDRLRVPHTVKRFASLRLALRAVWSEDRIESRLQRLRLLREELFLNLLVVIQ